MGKYSNIIFFLSGVAVASLIAALVSHFSRLNFWVCFGIVLLSMIINGLVAEYEDRKLGGFLNPRKDKKDDNIK